MAVQDFFVAAVLLSGAAGLTGVMAQSQTPPPKETIVYEHTTVSSRYNFHPTFDVSSVFADGSNVKQLTKDGNSRHPNWTRDGRQILFIEDNQAESVNGHHSDLPFGLYLVNRDGSNSHPLWQLSVDGAFNNHAEFSPDRKLIIGAFSKFWLLGGIPDRSLNIYLIPANGQGEAQVLVRDAGSPSWSPDGRKIAVSRHGSIQVLNADGSDAVTLSGLPGATYPVWSPDGKQIAFTAFTDHPHLWQIFLMNKDGSDSQQLTTDTNWSCQSPSWSPDGKRIAFSCESVCVTSLGSQINDLGPPCVRRLFVIPAGNPPSKLTPLMDDDAEAPVFAPLN